MIPRAKRHLSDDQKLMLRVLAEATGLLGTVEVASEMSKANSPLGPVFTTTRVLRIGRQLKDRGFVEMLGSPKSPKQWKVTLDGSERNDSAQGLI